MWSKRILIVGGVFLILGILVFVYATITTNTVDSVGDIGRYSSIALDSNGFAHISYKSDTDGSLRYCNNTLGSWTCREISTTVNLGDDSSIAIDSNNKIHIVDGDGYLPNSHLEYCNNSGGTWTCATITSDDLGYDSIAIDSNNIPHVINWGAGGLTYFNRSGGTWTSASVITNINSGGASIAIDSNNKIHTVNRGFDVTKLRYCNNTFGSWTCTNISGSWGFGYSIAIDSNNIVHISANNASSYLVYCNNSGGTWTCANVYNASTGTGKYSSITIGPNNLPYISSYANYSNVYNLVLCDKITGVWNCTNLSITDTNNLGTPSGRNLAIKKGRIVDTTNYSSFAHVSYYNNTDLIYTSTQIDNTNPLISYGSNVEVNNTNKSQTWIFVNVSINETNFKNVTFYLYNNSQINSTTFIDSTRTLNFTNLVDGLYYYNVTTYDDAGNYNSTSTNWIRLDTKAPALTLIRPLVQTYGTNLSLPLNYTVSDATTSVSICWYKVINSTGNIIINNVSLANCVNATFDVPRTDIYNLNLYANDTLNQLNFSTVVFSVSLTSPAVTLDYPASNQYLNSETNLKFNFTATDSDGISQCKLYSNFTGSWNLNETFTSVTSGVQKSTLKNLSNSLYFWNVWCNDTFNNGAWALNNLTFTVDTIYPNVSIDSITTTTGSQVISFNSSANDTNLNSCKFSIYNLAGGIDGTNENISISCNLNPHSATVSGFATYTLKFYSTDLAGNENFTNLSFTTSATSGGTTGGGGGSIVTLEDLGFCGDNTCNSARGEDFYSCPADCKAKFSDFNLDKIFFNCIDKDSTNECFWTKNPGYVTLFIIVVIVFMFFTLFQIKPNNSGNKRMVYVGPFKKKKRH